ncbi:AraC family transcriptional regulator [Agromyces protaetiae]|uniref:HTH-type transcriptional regulator RipA n=1 Tax=Agromyces protaetiae TaxID=2509455 RepID=A0A4P6FNB5_9MICO|nr:AraC family transcriptional regulator [Agromyces protaetiae]QAY71998.1 AraC family transcriptional regulator [Agromyces protaetiae]
MSRTGQILDVLDVAVDWDGVMTSSFAVRRDEEWGWHRHDVHELLWGTRGSLVVETAEGDHAVPWTVGLWIPAGTAHRVAAGSGTEFACTYVPRRLGGPRETTGAVGVPAVARAIFAELEARDLDAETRDLAERLVVRLLEDAELMRLDLPMPDDDRTRKIAEAVLDDPADQRTLDEWGSLVGASERNLSRLFKLETSLTFADWRTKARMRAAIGLLAADHPVGAVGRRVGYATPSAFVQAFRREFGTTPGAFAGGAATGAGHPVASASSDGGSATSG